MVTAIFLISLCEPTLKGQSEGSDRQPNIIFIMADDLGWGGILDPMDKKGFERLTWIVWPQRACDLPKSMLGARFVHPHARFS